MENPENNISARKFRDEKAERKCLTKGTGSENLRRELMSIGRGLKGKEVR
jgi:hypothetical protein